MSDTNKLFLLLGALALGGLIYLLSPVLTPFLFAALLAYIGDPLVDQLEKKLPRGLSVSIVFLFIIGAVALAIFFLLPLVERQVSFLVEKLPQYSNRIHETVLPWLRDTLGVERVLNLDALREAATQYWTKAGGIMANLVASVSRSGVALLAWLANLVLIPVLTFYLLRDWDILVERVHELIPRRIEATVATLARESDEVLGAFLRGQLTVMLGLAAIYAAGLWLVGLDLALLLGLLAGLVSFVPYLGFVVGIVAAGIAALLQFQDLFHLLPVVAVFAIGQAVEGMLLTPILVGDRIGLHPVAVIFAVLAGGQLFGFFGILLALPIAAVVMVLLRHAHERYLNSRLYAQ